MAYNLNDKIRMLKPYTVDTGNYSVRMDANESFLQPGEELQAAVRLALKQVKFNLYPDPLAAKVCALYAAYYGIEKGLLTAGNGSDELINLLIASFLQKGDRIVTLDYDFPMYDFFAHLAECNIVKCKKLEDLTVDADAVISTVQENRAGMLIFSNPCNPTSLGVTRENIRRIIENVDALVVLDEAYMDFWDQSLLSEVERYDNLVVLKTTSKMGFAALRLGFAVANRTITGALQAVKSPYNVNALTQAAASAVFMQPDAIKNAVEEIKHSKETLYREMRRLSELHHFTVLESRTNFITICAQQAESIFEQLKTRGILVRCLFGKYLRITCGAQRENLALVDALDDILAKGC